MFRMVATLCFFLAGSLFLAPFVGGCETITREDGSRVSVFKSATTQRIAGVQDTANAAAVVGKGTPIEAIAGFVGTLAGLILAFDQRRRKVTAQTAANSATCEAVKLSEEIGQLKSMLNTGVQNSMERSATIAANNIATRSKRKTS